MRETFSRLLAEAAASDERVLLLTGDHGYALFDRFRVKCADRFLNCGVAEQNMVGVAAGLAKAGFRPIVYGLSAFIPMRVLEQIKMDICYESLPVVLVGDGAGVVYSTLGASHQCAEDVAALRALPGIDIHSPADRFELEYCFGALLEAGRPSYLRLGKADCGDIHGQAPRVPLGNLIAVRGAASPVGIIATGSMVSRSVKIADDLGGMPVWSAPCIAPFNRVQLLEACRGLRQVFVAEEHSVVGGLGSLVAEIVAESGIGCRVRRLGIDNRFSELCGSYDYLLTCHGLGLDDMRRTVGAALSP
jgi:transketolase